jgi:DNA-directed RNA polymerase specialized sigma24 family protein
VSSGDVFAPTRWTLVLRASGDSGEGRAALSDLCAAYYQPVYAFLRRSGRNEDNARDLAHDFFERLLSRGGFSGPDPARGRFRNYLLGAVKYFLRDQRDHAFREKRGGGIPHQSIDAENEEAPALQVADSAADVDDAAFDREWALALMNRAIAALEAEYAGPKSAQFAALRPSLMGEGVASHAATAALLGMHEGAVKVAVHRMRLRFRTLLKSGIAQTLDDPSELEDEFRYLCSALSGAM